MSDYEDWSESELREEQIRMEGLPEEVMLRIFEHLSLRSLCVCAMVCQAWLALSEDNSLWASKIRRLQKLTDSPVKIRTLKRTARYVETCTSPFVDNTILLAMPLLERLMEEHALWLRLVLCDHTGGGLALRFHGLGGGLFIEPIGDWWLFNRRKRLDLRRGNLVTFHYERDEMISNTLLNGWSNLCENLLLNVWKANGMLFDQ
jgi:hypothetical protein